MVMRIIEDHYLWIVYKNFTILGILLLFVVIIFECLLTLLFGHKYLKYGEEIISYDD